MSAISNGKQSFMWPHPLLSCDRSPLAEIFHLLFTGKINGGDDETGGVG